MMIVKALSGLSLAMLFVTLLAFGLNLPVHAEADLELTRNRPQATLPGWSYRRPITITNSTGATLTNFQVKVTLNASNFNFAQAQSDGRDLRFTDSDATTLLNYWIEAYDSIAQTATLWVKVPSISTGIGAKTIYLFLGNAGATAASNGNATFDFFDNFELAATGYYTLSAATTALSGPAQAWEGTNPIHTLSVVELNQGGYQYWGYYGLQAGGGNIGLARSNDLVNWDKYAGNPMLPASDDARWASVITQSGTLYMVYNESYSTNPHLAVVTSTDGLTFGSPTVLVSDVNYVRIGNPDIFYNSNDSRFYLYWYEQDTRPVTSTYAIYARSASTVAELAAASTTMLFTSTALIAAPNMMYYDNTYFLATEELDGPIWTTHMYSSTSPTGVFTELPDSPLLRNGEACFFQHVFGTTMHAWYCKLTGSTWTLEHRTANLAAGRPQVPYLNATKWSPGGNETWSAQTAVQQDGTSGVVAQLVADPNRSGSQILKSSYTGTDYIVESSLRLLSGRVLGLGARVTDQDHLYSANLYEDLDGADNLYSYLWNLGASTLGRTPVGTINLNTWYKLGIVAHGTNFNISLEDTPLITVTDNTFASGFISLLGEAGTTAQYNDLRVRKYASAEPVANVGALQGPNAVTMQSATAYATAQSPDASGWLLGLLICAGAMLIVMRVATPKKLIR